MTVRAFSPWCQAWLRSLGAGAGERPPDRDVALAAALAARGRPATEAIVHVDRVLAGLVLDQVRLGVVEALEAHDGMPADDVPASAGGAPLVPVSSPRIDPEVWCDSGGAMYAVLADLGVCEPTFDGPEQMLECHALQRVYLPERADRYGFETQAYTGAEAAEALGLPPLPEVEGERCHAWANERGVVVEARIEQYLYGTYVGLRDGKAVADLFARLPDATRRTLGIIKGTTPAPEDERGTPEHVYDIEIGRIHTYRQGEEVTVAYRAPKYGA
jgi:hypothetical protein